MTHRIPVPTTFQLRSPQPADIPALLALEQQAFITDRLSRKRFRHWCRADNATFLVSTDPEKQVAGYALILYRRNSRKARLYSIAVSRQHRGLGLARQLLQAGEKAARENACLQLYLEVRPDNQPAIHLYQQLGYEMKGRLPAFYEDGVDALRFEKNLSENLI